MARGYILRCSWRLTQTGALMSLSPSSLSAMNSFSDYSERYYEMNFLLLF